MTLTTRSGAGPPDGSRATFGQQQAGNLIDACWLYCPYLGVWRDWLDKGWRAVESGGNELLTRYRMTIQRLEVVSAQWDGREEGPYVGRGGGDDVAVPEDLGFWQVQQGDFLS